MLSSRMLVFVSILSLAACGDEAFNSGPTGASGQVAGSSGSAAAGKAGTGGHQNLDSGLGGGAGAGGTMGGAAGAGGSGGEAVGGAGGDGGLGGEAGAAGGTVGGASGDGGLGEAGGEDAPDAGPVSECPASGRYFCTKSTAVDSWTGKRWQRSDLGVGKLWSDADSYCGVQATEGLQWRLPTKTELLSILQQGSPTIDPYAFPGLSEPADFWSSTYDGCPSAQSHWRINFEPAGDVSCWYYTLTANVRCVSDQ